MGLYSGGLIIGRISALEIWGAYFGEGLFIYLFILFIYLFFGGGGVVIIGLLRYLTRATSSYLRKKAGFFLASQRKTPTIQKNRVMKTQKATRQAQIKKSKS